MEKQITNAFFQKMLSPIKHIFDRKNKSLLHTIEWVILLLAFFFIGFSMIYYQEANFPLVVRNGEYPDDNDKLTIVSDGGKTFIGEVIPEPIDTTSWDTYQNKWYGFEIQHPDTWKNNTQYKTATEKSAVYETIYKFRKNEEDGSETYVGYDVKIYTIKKVQEVENTNDIHKKENAPQEADECALNMEEIKSENEDLVFKKISINESNPCYEPAYFYSVAKGDYIYNIVPSVGESGERFSDPEKETTRLFPEYKEAIDFFRLIPIVRPKPKPDPRIGVQKPVSAKIVNGKLVCAKKNDKPGKSKKNKPGHLDLECCLDPDETPNPWCTY